LVQAMNKMRLASGWKPIPLDAESEFVLSKQGFVVDDIPPAGTEARLRTQGNLSTGGTMEVVTDRVHPDNVQLALRAAAIAGIDLAGLDFITTDITRSHLDVGGAICEINVTPGFILGEEELVLGDWFPEGDDGRIPTVVVLDLAPNGSLGRRIASLLSTRLAPVCLATTRGIWLADAKIASGDQGNAQGTQIALSEPFAAAAVVELDSREVMQNGFRFDRCTALIVPPVPANAALHPDQVRREAIDLLAAAARVVMLDADDPASATRIADLKSARFRLIRTPDSASVTPPAAGEAPTPWEAELLRTLAAELSL
jgi:cyanophycin synthetase